MHRTYLFVPPEERSEVEALGAQWDAVTKRWYVDGEPASNLARWSSLLEDGEYSVVSNDAHVAITTVACPHCGATTEVICIHCLSGAMSEQEIERFTVSDISAMDEDLRQSLKRWPRFRQTEQADGLGDFANHCAACGEMIADLDLHSEPDHAFFDIVHAAEGAITLVPLPGTIRLIGSGHFVIE